MSAETPGALAGVRVLDLSRVLAGPYCSMLLADYGKYVLLPESQFKDAPRPKTSIPESLGHHQEWIHACKTGAPTTCHFDYAGALTEANHLGNVAYRTGRTLEWDAVKLEARGVPEAQAIIRRAYRPGWSLQA